MKNILYYSIIDAPEIGMAFFLYSLLNYKEREKKYKKYHKYFIYNLLLIYLI